jgi:alpha-ribazole phosphatase
MEDNNQQKNIYFIRHPKTLAKDGVCYGNSDVIASEDALQEASDKVKTKLKDITPDICYTSPLLRCKKLAERIVGLDILVEDDLIRELNFASWEMKPWSEIPQKEQEEWGNDFINSKVHGGENYYDVQNRVVQFLEKVTQSTDNEILAVTHTGIIRAVLAYLLDASPYKIFAIDADYGDVVRIKWSNKDYYRIKFL